MNQTVIREGLLLQRQKQTWKERYFVLYPQKLACYKDAEKHVADSKGDFDLASHAYLEVLPADQQKSGTSGVSEFRFALTAKEHRLIWAASTPDEMNAWAASIASILGVVKSGNLFKQGQEGKLSRQNWKHRYFVMNNDSIKWFRHCGGEQRGEMKLTEHVMLEIMPEDSGKHGQANSSDWRLRITAGDRRLLIAAESEDAMHSWAAALQSVVGGNLIVEGSTAESKRKMSNALNSLHRYMAVDRLAGAANGGNQSLISSSSPKVRSAQRASMFGQDNQMLANKMRQERVRKSLAVKSKGQKMRFSIAKDSASGLVKMQGTPPARKSTSGGMRLRSKTREQVAADVATTKAAVQQALEEQESQVWCPDPVLGWMLRKVVRRDPQARTVEIEPLSTEELKSVQEKVTGGVVMNNARIRSASGAKKNVLLKKRMKTIFKNVEVQPLDPTHLQDLDDIADMDNLHEAPLLNLLKRRYDKDGIYTHVGDVLVSLNPFKPIANLYELPAQSELRQRSMASLHCKEDDGEALAAVAALAPHVYSTADKAYGQLLQGLSNGRRDNQSILVSGESGAGKTEACKYIMRYLAAASKTMQTDSDFGSVDVEQCLLQSNPLLEAFGNAVTLRNNNSSRFGKLIRISYNKGGCMIGAHTQHFLLEKSRVVMHTVGERNYHIFYQLTADAQARSDLGMLTTSEYAYLRDTDESKISHSAKKGEEGDGASQGWWEGSSGVPKANLGLPERRTSVMELPDDSTEFRVTCEALEACGVSEQERRWLQEVLAAVLSLGNLEFTEDELQRSSVKPAPSMSAASDPANGGGSGNSGTEDHESSLIGDIAATLGFVPALLELKLTQRELSAGSRSSTHRVPLTQQQAQHSRDAFAKAVYANLFGWLVEKVNSAVTVEEEKSKSERQGEHFLGLLDIFGFEVMQHNSFEQLCINYANEVLQHFFNQRVFVKEQAFYQQEQVQLPKVWYQDNAAILELIRGSPSGILMLLDQQNKLGGSGSDKQFLSSIYRAHGGAAGSAKHLAHSTDGNQHPNLLRPRFGGDTFIIKHFAGQVQYTAKGFLDKNNESLTNDLAMLILTTTNDFLKDIFDTSPTPMAGESDIHVPKMKKVGSRGGPGGDKEMNKLLGSETVSLTFRQQMDSLQKILQTTTSHFLRCVKPNSNQIPASFNGPMILEQLMYLGVLETIRIRQNGYPVRKGFAEFIKLYKPLTAQLDVDVRIHGEKEVVKSIVQAYLDPQAWQVGVTRVFLKTGQTMLLDQAVLRLRYQSATRLQALVRKREDLKRYAIARRAVIKVQAVIRGFLGACRAQRIYTCKVSATKLVAFYRASSQRREFLSTRKGVTHLQAATRGAQYRKSHGILHLSAAAIQKTVRRRQRWQVYQRQQWAALWIHTIARGFLGRLLRKKLGTDYKSAQRIQAQIRCFVARRQYLRKRRNAAILLQKVARMRQAYRKWQAMLVVSRLQRIFRAVNVRKSLVAKEIEMGKDGMLHKRSVRGRRGYNWKYRQFHLTGQKLEYKKVEGVMSKFKSQKGVFLLDDKSEVKQSDIHEHCFMVSGTFTKKLGKDGEGEEEGEQRELYCYASSEEERDEWMKKLALAIYTCNADKEKELTMARLLHLRRQVVDPDSGKANPKSNILGLVTMGGGGKRRSSKSASVETKRKSELALELANGDGDGRGSKTPPKKQRSSLVNKFRSKSNADKKRKSKSSAGSDDGDAV